MFNHLKHKVIAVLVIVISLCISLVSTMTYLIIRQNIYDNYVKLSLQYVTQQHQNCQLYMKLIEETSKLVSGNQIILSALTNHEDYSSVERILDGARAANTSIIGLSLYGTGKLVCTSSNVPNPPELEDICRNKLVNDFTHSSQITLWQVRRNDILNFYDNIYMNRLTGVYTLFLKIHDPKGNLVGYLIIDTNMKTLFNFYDTRYNHSLGANNTYVLANDGSFLAAPYNKVTDHTIPNNIITNKNRSTGSFLTNNGRFLIIYKQLSYSKEMAVITLELNKILRKLVFLRNTFIILSICFIGISVLFINILSKSISQPLNKLYDKMRQTL